MTTPMNPQEYKEAIDEILFALANYAYGVGAASGYGVFVGGEPQKEARTALLHLIEKAQVEAITNEIKLIQLFTAGRTYHEGTDWRHEVELYEQMLDNRLATLRNQTGEA